MRKRINIMCACDDNIAHYIFPQLASIYVNMPEHDIHYYLFHFRISERKLNGVREYAKILKNITFHEVIMQNIPELEQLAKYGGRFPAEAYVYLHCHDQLPEDMERIIYIGVDMVMHGDISDYYFTDFDGKSFVGPLEVFDVVNEDGTTRELEAKDADNPIYADLLRQTYANSGAIVLNLPKFRANSEGLMQRYMDIADKVRAMGLECIQECEGTAWLGDQGIMGLAYVGDIKFFGYEEIVKETMHFWPRAEIKANHIQNMYFPYNYVQWGGINEGSTWYIPAILHFGSPFPKPWDRRYTEDDIGEIEAEDGIYIRARKYSGLRREYIQMHKIWWEYAALTPLASADPQKVRGMDATLRDKNLFHINPLQYMAEYHLAGLRYSEALEFIEKGLALASHETDSFQALWQIKVRAFLENTADPKRFKKALDVINEYMKITKPSYMWVNMHHYKGFCLQHLGKHKKAIESFMESTTCITAAEQGIIESGSGTVFFPANPTVNRTTRNPITPSDNARFITVCYFLLEDYANAAEWARRVNISYRNNIKKYFNMLNEEGQMSRVGKLFNRLADLRGDKNKPMPDDFIDAFKEFDKLLLEDPCMESIVAPFFDDYIGYVHDYIGRTGSEPQNRVHIMAYNLHISDKLLAEGNKKDAREHFKKAFSADERFVPLLSERLENF